MEREGDRDSRELLGKAAPSMVGWGYPFSNSQSRMLDKLENWFPKGPLLNKRHWLPGSLPVA